jgi:hypothetical protein
MTLERDPTHLGDIGDHEPEQELDPDRIYEQAIEQRKERDE